MKILALLTLTALAVLHAEVVDSSSSGFNLKTTLTIQAAPEEVYGKLVHNVGDWWDPVHTYSHDPHNLSIEEKAMGCFCEKLPNSGMVRHLEVVAVMPGKSIGFTGAMGPMQSIAAGGNMRIQLTAAEGGTKLELSYAVFGYLPAGLNTWAPIVDTVLKEQVTRLKNYVEHGNPAPK